MTHALFEVSGRRQYRGHAPGTRFEARIEAAIQRALDRGDVLLVEMVTPEVPPGYWLPTDWPPPGADAAAHTEAPKGASLVSEGGKK